MACNKFSAILGVQRYRGVLGSGRQGNPQYVQAPCADRERRCNTYSPLLRARFPLHPPSPQHRRRNATIFSSSHSAGPSTPATSLPSNQCSPPPPTVARFEGPGGGVMRNGAQRNNRRNGLRQSGAEESVGCDVLQLLTPELSFPPNWDDCVSSDHL